MKCFLTLIVFLLSCPAPCICQWSDDFSDGDLQGWIGDVSHFTVNPSHQLQLNAPPGSTSSGIFRTDTFAGSMSWDVYFMLDFSPSTSNQLRIFLGLTDMDLSNASGYFVEAGAAGDQDAIEFKFLHEGTAITIATSMPGIVATAPVEFHLQVTCDHLGTWSFYDAGPTDPEWLFSASHDQLLLTQLHVFGIFAKYSDTRRDKFFFDDIRVARFVSDTVGPGVQTALPNEIIITEIMADPSPVVGLPETEYIELYNAGNELFNLGDYTIQVGNNKKNLPDSILLPREFAVVVSSIAAHHFYDFGKVIAVDPLPSLTNGGTTVTIKNSANEIINTVSYTDEWYNESGKSSGGWSLELIDPLRVCSMSDNWTASIDLRGGTPGKINSVWHEAGDVQGPRVESIYASDEYTIVIGFDEKLDSLIMTDPALYKFEPEVVVDKTEIAENRVIIISVSNALLKRMPYSLLPFDAYDCLGNYASTDTLEFGLGETAQPGDMLINEILFNPASGGSRFIELVNMSDKYIELRELVIGRAGTSQLYPTGVREVVGPGQLVVFSDNRDDILSRYSVANEENLYVAELPAWDENGDNAAVIAGGMIIDSFTYSSMWHHPVIADQNGVSLERISVTEDTQDPSNWHSAALTHKAATPTGINSQAKVLPVIQSPFSIINKQFSPNNDGFNDFMLMKFELDSGLDVGSIWVYDLAGREIHQILSNETIGTSAMIQWDGRNAEGVVAHMGIYLIFVELWDTTGRVRHFQESVALVNR